MIAILSGLQSFGRDHTGKYCIRNLPAFSATKNNYSEPSCDTLPTTQLISYLGQMNVQSYYGKPVDSFLLAIPANLYNMKIYGGSNSQGALFRASEMVVNFLPVGDCPGVVIHVRQFTHMNRYSPTATWDVNLFRQEKIDRMEVWRDQNTCINGDCMH